MCLVYKVKIVGLIDTGSVIIHGDLLYHIVLSVRLEFSKVKEMC